MHGICIDQLTVWGASPPECVEIAAGLECEAVSLWVQSFSAEAAAPPLIEDKKLRDTTLRALAATGVRVEAIECFLIAPDADMDSYRPALATGAELGAKSATAIVFEPDFGRATEDFAKLAEYARAEGIRLNVEFLAFSPIANIGLAADLVRAAGVKGCGIVVDSMHMTRSGGSPADIARLDPALIGAVQICDGPPTMSEELQMFHEGFEQRMPPGEGTFALVDFVRALPPDKLIGIEVPRKDLADRGIGPAERARLAVTATRKVIEDAMNG